MWSIWSSRNRWTHGEKGSDPNVAVKIVHDTLMELELPPKNSVSKEARPECTWHRPSNDIIKLNIDGAVNAQVMVAGSGGVARDATGGFRGAWCKAYPGIVNPLTSEALALRDAVVFAQAQNFRQITIETDCSELVRLWEARRRSRPLISPLLEDVSSLSLGFQAFSISFARRSANNSAHECARYACLHNLSDKSRFPSKQP
jgi:ribonuclease HI